MHAYADPFKEENRHKTAVATQSYTWLLSSNKAPLLLESSWCHRLRLGRTSGKTGADMSVAPFALIQLSLVEKMH